MKGATPFTVSLLLLRAITPPGKMAPRKKRAASDDFDSVSDFEPEASPDVSEAGSDPGSSDYDEAPKRGAPKRKAPAKKGALLLAAAADSSRNAAAAAA